MTSRIGDALNARNMLRDALLESKARAEQAMAERKERYEVCRATSTPYTIREILPYISQYDLVSLAETCYRLHNRPRASQIMPMQIILG